MNVPFDPSQGLVVIQAEVFGLSGSALLRLALDTGATTTLLSAGPLVALGYDPASAPDRVQITTRSGIEFAPRLPIVSLVALGQTRQNFQVLCHTLPPSAGVDGLLGLDFFRGQTLILDFEEGTIRLN